LIEQEKSEIFQLKSKIIRHEEEVNMREDIEEDDTM